jgi:hypothetical protein
VVLGAGLAVDGCGGEGEETEREDEGGEFHGG